MITCRSWVQSLVVFNFCAECTRTHSDSAVCAELLGLRVVPCGVRTDPHSLCGLARNYCISAWSPCGVHAEYVGECKDLNLLDYVGLPSWGSWEYSQKYLPAEVHTKDGFRAALAVICKVSGSSGVLHGGVVLRYGLLLREVEHVHFLLSDPDEPLPPPPGTPEWVAKLALEMSWKNSIFSSMATAL